MSKREQETSIFLWRSRMGMTAVREHIFSKRSHKTMAEKQTNRERLREITDGIAQGIQELFQSDKYRSYLSVLYSYLYMELSAKAFTLADISAVFPVSAADCLRPDWLADLCIDIFINSLSFFAGALFFCFGQSVSYRFDDPV